MQSLASLGFRGDELHSNCDQGHGNAVAFFDALGSQLHSRRPAILAYTVAAGASPSGLPASSMMAENDPMTWTPSAIVAAPPPPSSLGSCGGSTPPPLPSGSDNHTDATTMPAANLLNCGDAINNGSNVVNHCAPANGSNVVCQPASSSSLLWESFFPPLKRDDPSKAATSCQHKECHDDKSEASSYAPPAVNMAPSAAASLQQSCWGCRGRATAAVPATSLQLSTSSTPCAVVAPAMAKASSAATAGASVRSGKVCEDLNLQVKAQNMGLF